MVFVHYTALCATSPSIIRMVFIYAIWGKGKIIEIEDRNQYQTSSLQHKKGWKLAE